MSPGNVHLKRAAEASCHLGALLALHDTPGAVAAYREATELDPESASAWGGLACALRRAGDIEGADHAQARAAVLGHPVFKTKRAPPMTTYHCAASVDVDRFSDARLRSVWLPLFRQLGCQTPQDIRQLCAEARQRGQKVFAPCDNVGPDGVCLGHEEAS